MRRTSSFPSHSRRLRPSFVAVGLAIALLTAACTDDSPPATEEGRGERVATCEPEQIPDAIERDAVEAADVDGTTVRLITHDSFAVSDGLFDRFTEETGITVELMTSEDAGTLVSQSILTAGNPVADVLFGIDTTFLCRGLAGDVFVPYESAALADVPGEYQYGAAKDPVNLAGMLAENVLNGDMPVADWLDLGRTGALILVTLVCGRFEFYAGTVPSLPAPMPGVGDPCEP